MATATITAAPVRWEVIRVWEWEDGNGEPHSRIESYNRFTYDQHRIASACADTYNEMRSKASIGAGMYFDVRMVGES